MRAGDVNGDAVVDWLGDIIARRGAESYEGEAVSMAEHMLQCAALAAEAGAPDELVAAALLHDIGHFTGELGEYAPTDTVDRKHDVAGGRALEPYFPPVVVAAVRLHVAAKRYLCATNDRYHDRLSAPSRHSLTLQGGAMDASEIAAFEAQDFHREAVCVRRWDDDAKRPGKAIPTFSDFAPLLRAIVMRDTVR